MNTQQKGDLACAKVVLRATEKQITVSKPLSEVRYDLVLDLDGVLKKVQVKYADGKARGRKSSKEDVVVAKTCSMPGRNNNHKVKYKSDEIDAIVIYTPATDKIYWFNMKDIGDREEIHIRFTKPRNGQLQKSIMATDYEW